ncbi:BACON domain-containing protein [Marinifilum caeruleilacunae]|uniref:BACON domain-containing protein n=1 Tax=Marinifilum caeruleilacunae TaxID=2499076 RepID=A0ABX1X1R7_9BACT|nr:BACON domain-containing protein [Marinifilum caeruleilacunae]NOU62336.1 hypothetical protein [Marinifilum caeruleilacunae]
MHLLLDKKVSLNFRYRFVQLALTLYIKEHISADTDHLLFNAYVNETLSLEEQTTTFTNPLGGKKTLVTSSGNSSLINVHNHTKVTYPEALKIDGEIIVNFTYEENEFKFYENYTYDFKSNQKNLRIKSIDINDVNQKGFRFNYAYLGNAYKRLFLEKIEEINGIKGIVKGTYDFEYHQLDKITSPLTRNIDYWGFSNGGNDETANLIPTTHITEDGDFHYDSDEREPKKSLCNVGLLKKITYPTGGYTKIDYEGHDYSYRLERRSENNFLAELNSIPGDAGGARVQKIIDFDGTSELNIREFKYRKDYFMFGEASASSGVLLDWPRYVYYWLYEDGYWRIKAGRGQSSSFYKDYFNENYISYSEVVEIINNSQYRVYYYSDYESNPNTNHFHKEVLDESYEENVVQRELYNNYYGIRSNDKSGERGLLLGEKIFNVEKNCIQEYINEYSFSNDTTMFVVGLIPTTGAVSTTYKLFSYPINLVKKTQKQYDKAGVELINSFQTYSYESNYNLLREKISHNSVGEEILINYLYPTDFNFESIIAEYSDQEYLNCLEAQTLCEEEKILCELDCMKQHKFDEEAYNNCISYCPTCDEGCDDLPGFPFDEFTGGVYKMQESNIFKPLEKITYVKQNNVQKVIKSELIKFKKVGSNLAKSFETQILTNKTPVDINNFNALNLNEAGALEYDDKYNLDFKIEKYNSAGRVLQYQTKSGISVVILWDDKNIYPMAKIEGIAYDDVEEYDSKPANYNSQQYYSSLKLAVPDAIITTYSYLSLIGMTSMTDTNGVSTIYEYDDFGRLSCLKDNNDNILQTYHYNYEKEVNFSSLEVSTNSLSCIYSGETKDVDVTSNVSWLVSSDKGWISVIPESGTGDQVLQIKCDSTTITSSRQGTVTITGDGIIKTIMIEQDAAPTLSLSRNNLSVNGDYSLVTVNVNSNVNWTVSSNKPWLAGVPSTGSNDGTFQVQCEINPKTTSRDGIITVSGGGIEKTINVTQAAGTGGLPQ